MKSNDPWWSQGAPKKSIARSWTLGSTFVVTVVIGIITAGLGTVIVGFQAPKVKDWEWGQEYRASINALASGCGPIYTISDAAYLSRQVGSVPESDIEGNPIALNYVSTVPFAGTMYELGVDTGKQTTWNPGEPSAPRVEKVLRSLYDGWMVAYYSQDATENQKDSLIFTAQNQPELKMMVVPWPKDRAKIPQNRNVAYAVWGATQQCANVLVSQIREFREAFPISGAPGFNGLVPRSLTFAETGLQILDPASSSPPSKTSDSSRSSMGPREGGSNSLEFPRNNTKGSR
jgi:hypothetical protein